MKLFGNWRKQKTDNAETAFVPAETAPAAVKQDSSLGRSRKILVVDDNPVVLKAFELKLKALGFQVLIASEGATAVSLARQERPDLIVLDINFPPDVGSSGLQWDGFNIMQWMQRFQEVANIPVIIITSSDPSKLKDKAISKADQPRGIPHRRSPDSRPERSQTPGRISRFPLRRLRDRAH
jgi:CheY-like chemotaxis protein